MLKQLARNVFPERLHYSHYCPKYLTSLVKKKTGVKVHKGPFRGLNYISYSLASVYLPKLLGTYEQELHQIIEEACSLNIDHIIDIGAAEGYYAVGMAFRFANAKVTAFEMEPVGRDAVAELAKANQVEDRVNVLGKCEGKNLEQALSNGKLNLIICDVEGDEENLLDTKKVPGLKRAYILVELHDFIKPGISDEIRCRFRASHSIEEIWQESRSLSDFPFKTIQTRLLPSVYIENELNEFRCERMRWFWMKPLRDL